jgi:hypothetical protein
MTMKTNHTTHEFHFTHRIELDFSPLLRSFVMPLFEDLSAAIADAKQAAIAEHQEVMDAIAALQTGVTTDPNLNLTADQKTQIVGMIDDLKTSIQNVHDASTVTPTTPTTPTIPPTGPTDVTGTPTPTLTTPPTGVTGTIDVTGTVPPAPNPNPGP